MDKEFLARGKRGITYRSNYHGKEVVIKEKNPKSTALGTIENEYNFLKELNEHDIGAKVLAFEDDKLIMEFIHGELIIDFLEKHSKDEILNVLKNIFKQLRTMDELKINKAELTYPYKHIIISESKPIMIDFERCRKTEKPQNVNQFCQFLISDRIIGILDKKGIKINKDEIMEKAKAYKDNYSDDAYNDLLRVIL